MVGNPIQDWQEAAHQFVEDRFEVCQAYIKSEVENMMKDFITKSGRWDLEGLRIYWAEKVGEQKVVMAD